MSSKLTYATNGEIKCPFCQATSTYFLEAHFHKNAPDGNKWYLAPLVIPACRHMDGSEWELTDKAWKQWQTTHDLELANTLEWEVLVYNNELIN
jgi:hypothetical protein